MTAWSVLIDGGPAAPTSYTPAAVVSGGFWCRQAETATPDRALVRARELAKEFPKGAVLVRCGAQDRWLLWRGEAWAVRPGGGWEATW